MDDEPTVLSGADLDLLELALTFDGLVLEAADGVRILADPDRTPVARLEAGRPVPLRPLAARPELAGLPSNPSAPIIGAELAVAFDALPTRTQLDALTERAPSGAVAWIALAGRARPDAGALARGVAAAADAWAARTGRSAPVAVLPWALHARPAVLAAPGLPAQEALPAWLAGALGVPEVLLFGEGEEHRALARLERDAAGAARALFPAEVLPFHRPAATAGAVVLLTGLPGSGKSTIARALAARIAADGGPTRVLDGDEVRRTLSDDLGFDPDGRAANLRRIGWVAAQLAGVGATAIASPIAPFTAGRAEVRRAAIGAGARFLLVHVATPAAVCEQRDRKGHWAAARAGRLPDFTGVSSPYEAPDDADVVVGADARPVDEAVDAVLAVLRSGTR